MLILVLQFGKVQTVLSNNLLTYLNKKYDVSLHLDELKINPFGDFRFENLLVKDHHKDTLIYLSHLEGNIIAYQKIKNKQLTFDNVKLEKGFVNNYIYPNDSIGSLTLFLNKFKGKKKKKEPFKVLLNNVQSKDLRYLISNKKTRFVDFKNISGTVNYIESKGSGIHIVSDSLSFKDIYGIKYLKFKTDFRFSSSKMSFDDTHIKTINSDLCLKAHFKFNPGDFSHFVTKVKVDSEIFTSCLSLKDIHKIYPHYKNGKTFELKSLLTGTFNDLTLTNTKILSKDNETSLMGDFLLKNSIVNREQFLFIGKETKIKTPSNSLNELIPDIYHRSFPSIFKNFQFINYNGALSISREYIDFDGEIASAMGRLKLNGFLSDLHKKKTNLNIDIAHGSILEKTHFKSFKNISFKGNIKGNLNDKTVFLDSKLNFNKIGYKELKLSDSDLSFKYENKNITANFITRDSLLSFYSNIAYTNRSKEEKDYNLDFEVTKGKLSKLFPRKTSYQENVLAKGRIHISQNKDNTVANGLIDSLRIETTSDTLDLNKVNFKYLSEGKTKKIDLNSKDLLDLDVEGVFNLYDFEKLVENAIHKFIPGKKVRKNIKDQRLNFGLEIYPKFLKSITDKVILNKNIKISGVLDTNGDKGLIYASAPSFSSKDIEADSLIVFLDNSNKWINSNISMHKLRFKRQVYDDISLLGKKINDTLFVRSNFNTDKIDNRAVFNLTTKKNEFTLGIENVYFKYLNSTWVNKDEKENKIKYNYRTGNWNFDEVSFANKEQEFDFRGTIKKGDSKNLRLALKNINLGEVLPSIDSLKIGGIASGEVFFREKNTLLKPDGNLVIQDLMLNGIDYGLLKTSIKPSVKELGYDLKFNISDEEVQNIDATGQIIVDKTNFLESQIDLKMVLNHLKLNSLSPLGRNVLSAIKGEAKGDFSISGKLNDFNSYGFIELSDVGLKFPYLNTNYNFTGDSRIELEGKNFVFKDLNIEDDLHKTQGVLGGFIEYDKYNNWTLNLRVDSKKLLVLNTIKKENSKYYGTVFMDGFVTIKGKTSDLLINVNGRTLEHTKFTLPISEIKQIEKNRFIYFKNVEEDESKKEEVLIKSGGVSVVLNLDITKDALGEVVIDQSSGSSLQGRVDGKLLIDIDEYFNIKMYGDLVVDEGQYNFKYGGVINKPFIVKKGGTVAWNGDPYKANLNIEAVHSVKANPKVLLENLTINRKIDVDLVTRVTGELFESKQDFMIEIPNTSSTVTSELDFKLNVDEDSKMRQFFSLLVSKSFFDENGENNTSSVLSNTTSELISNAITDIFNQEGGKFQFNFGYTSGETSEIEESSIDNQIDIGLQTEINDRILINGKLGVPVGTKTQSAVVGEVKIEFLLNEEGTLKSSVFNRQNEIQYSEEEEGYTQGVGLNYQIDFNNLKEMFDKLKRKKKSK